MRVGAEQIGTRVRSGKDDARIPAVKIRRHNGIGGVSPMEKEKTSAMSDNQAVQNEILNIFTEIKKILERHNLRYFAIGGTCLGAVRHNGFIPWDNDMDIAMPEKDYAEFLRIAPQELPAHLKLRTPENTPSSAALYSKVQNIRTTYIEEHELEHTDLYKGVFVDIMPLCGVPAKRKLYCKMNWLFHEINIYARCHLKETGIKKAMNRILRRFSRIAGSNFFYRKWYHYVTKYKFDTEKYVGYVWSLHITADSRLFLKEWFADYVEMPFAGTTVRCPVGWHDYLTKQFHNYMELPPEEQRASGHHVVLLDLERPYAYYADLAKKGELKV